MFDSYVYYYFTTVLPFFIVHLHRFVVIYAIYEFCGPKYCHLLEYVNNYTPSGP